MIFSKNNLFPAIFWKMPPKRGISLNNEEYVGEHLPKIVINQLPNRSLKFFYPDVSSKAIQKLCFNLFLITAFDPSKRCRIFVFLQHISQKHLGVFVEHVQQDLLEISCGRSLARKAQRIYHRTIFKTCVFRYLHQIFFSMFL